MLVSLVMFKTAAFRSRFSHYGFGDVLEEQAAGTLEGDQLAAGAELD
jgi:hypothetical protein